MKKLLTMLFAAMLLTRIIQAQSVLTKLANFISSDGSQPRGDLILGTDGNFYGTTLTGG